MPAMLDIYMCFDKSRVCVLRISNIWEREKERERERERKAVGK